MLCIYTGIPVETSLVLFQTDGVTARTGSITTRVAESNAQIAVSTHSSRETVVFLYSHTANKMQAIVTVAA